MHFLIYHTGTPQAEQALVLGARLAQAAGARLTVVGAEGARPAQELPAGALWHTLPQLGPRGVLAEIQAELPDLVVVGSRGLRGWMRVAFGSRAGRLARYSPVPVLIVKGTPRPAIRRVLACTGGAAAGERVARWGGRLAGWTGAELAVLHVMSQLALTPRAPQRPLEESAEEAISERTREGEHLARELAVARAAAGAGPGAAPLVVRPKLRHGLVVDEVVAETRALDYDLVVVGGHQAPDSSAGLDQVRAHLLEDVADEIVGALERPVLVVKGP
jgi:nucleotide-binding universal stress UspA family protein